MDGQISYNLQKETINYMEVSLSVSKFNPNDLDLYMISLFTVYYLCLDKRVITALNLNQQLINNARRNKLLFAASKFQFTQKKDIEENQGKKSPFTMSYYWHQFVFNTYNSILQHLHLVPFKLCLRAEKHNTE